jgi:hypothetical protein
MFPIQSLKTGRQYRALNPFINNNGLIRVDGRIKHFNLAYLKKYPIVSPKKNHTTELIIRDIHEGNFHSEIHTTLHTVRDKL